MEGSCCCLWQLTAFHEVLRDVVINGDGDGSFIDVNPRTYKQSHPPPVVQGGEGVMEPLSWVFAVFQYFGEILPLIESL